MKNNINFKPIIVLIIGLLFIGYNYINNDLNNQNLNQANDYQEIVQDKSIRCIDGDTFEIIEGNEKKKVRLLAIDAPEDTKKKELYGDIASKFTCNALNNATEIRFDYDVGNEFDKYDRYLYWVFVDDVLLQELLVKNGLAEIKYVHKKTVNKIYLSKLEIAEEFARLKRLNIWE